MSENLNRSTPDFSKYDSMSIGELEEILCADAQGPERDDSDVDEILYIMEVLAKKRRQNDIAGKTAHEAYQEFQQYYLPIVEEEEDIESGLRRKTPIIPFRRIAAIAASLVLIFSLTVSVNAFSFKDIWNVVAKWAEETFSFSIGVGVSEPKAESELSYSSLREALIRDGRNYNIIPTVISDGYELDSIIVDRNPTQESYVAIFTNGEDWLRITVQSYVANRPEQIEKSDGFSEIYIASDINYYLFSNHEVNRAVWIIDTYECSISGVLPIEEIKLMIDSIRKE